MCALPLDHCPAPHHQKKLAAHMQSVLGVLAAIDSQATCTEVGGVFKPAACAIETKPLCNAAGGQWDARDRFSLKNGMVSRSVWTVWQALHFMALVACVRVSQTRYLPRCFTA